MNTESNKQKWIKMVNDTLTMGGKSKITINKYTYAIERFLNAHGNNTKISAFTEKEIIKYLKKKFIDTKLKATTYKQKKKDNFWVFFLILLIIHKKEF